MDGALLSPAERRRIARLAAAVPHDRWIVAPEDPGAEAACCAAAASQASVLSVSPASPLSGLHRLTAAGLRQRVHLSGGWPSAAAEGWERPIGLLVVPAGSRAMRALMAAWAGYVCPRGFIAFYGGRAADARALGLRPDFWACYPRGVAAPFLLMRRPVGCTHCY